MGPRTQHEWRRAISKLHAAEKISPVAFLVRDVHPAQAYRMNVEGAPQSWSGALVDIATIGVLLAMALNHVQDAAPWTLLGSVVAGRFGVSLGKSIERTAARSGGDDGRPPGSSGRSGQMRAVPETYREQPTSEPNPPKGTPRVTRTLMINARMIAYGLAVLVAIACFVVARFRLDHMIANR